MSAVIADIPIIDTDTHVVEPPDLWSSRMSSRWGDMVPHVQWDPSTEDEGWFCGDTRIGTCGSAAMAGWHEYPPFHPRRFSDTDPVASDPVKRLAFMDANGIHAQMLYPNVAVFNAKTILDMNEPDLHLEMIRAYNDYLTDWHTLAPGRFIAISSLPFWDLDETLKEMERTAAAGHKGVAFTQDPRNFGLPDLTDRYWDPLWASAQEKQLPINFHIASGNLDLMTAGNPQNGIHANYASMGVSFFMGNARTLALLTTGGICHRFPKLDFVSVESGIGWIPFALESLDWQWKNCGVHLEHPEYDLLPSEYFRRQIYGCFWFERESATSALELLGPDNILYETDYPHPTSMSPGPATTAVAPQQYIAETFAAVDEGVMRKILHDNAARVYHLG